ncbi:MAG TPA: ADP-ribosylglycohydrolase family protein [Casimicrobiaceae bacterium]|nr:ADP-ribosylglycohydrolase family protein [Casimicrobiaceae bacterium]
MKPPSPSADVDTTTIVPGTVVRDTTTRLHRPKPTPERRRRWRGCLVGGAVGDALGAPVEFMSLEEIRATLGPVGVHGYLEAFGRYGAITDDTQLTMFTAEGLLRAYACGAMTGSADVPAIVANAYLRWLHTQRETAAVAPDLDGWLLREKALFASRVPGITVVDALRKRASFGERPRNTSKGCGGVMRVAPVGLYCARLHEGMSGDRIAKHALELGADTAALTHGHPTGQLAAGYVAALVALLALDLPLPDALDRAAALLVRRPGHAETMAAVEHARKLAAAGEPRPEYVARLGEGWTADEAVAIAVYCLIAASDFDAGVRLAVNHDGDSDSTGAIAGNLLGTLHGIESIPTRFTNSLEMVDVVAVLADDLATFPAWPIGQFQPATDASAWWLERYPPS